MEEDKIDVFGVKLDCLTAKETMIRAMQFLENNTVDTIEFVSLDTLMAGRDDDDWKRLTGTMKILLPADVDILEAAGIKDRKKLRETEDRIFLRMFMKYLQKNHRRIFFVAESEEEAAKVEDAVRRYNKGIRISGRAVLPPGADREEDIVNEINGTETDCIFSVLPSPYQEDFAEKYGPLLNAKVWFGCGKTMLSSYGERGIFRRIRRSFVRRLFRHKMEKEYRDK